MSTEIYYFSGTGNSLHVARELQKRMPEAKLIPLISLVDRDAIATNAELVGFVFPIHFITLPMIVKSFIKKIEISSAKYVFAIATRYGTPCNTAFSKLERILKAKGKTLDAYLVLNMPSNDPKFVGWSRPSEEQMLELENEVQERLDLFQAKINNRDRYQGNDAPIILPVNRVFEHLSSFMAEMSGDPGKAFIADESCVGCGSCEAICLSGKIKIKDQKPVWDTQVRCYSCYACLNFCPQQAVQMKSGRLIKFYTDTNGRYHHPGASATDIAGQKRGR